MATAIDKNQYDYLTNLSKTGSAGNQAWAKSQLANSSYTQPVAPKPTTPTPTPSTTTTMTGPVLPGAQRPTVNIPTPTPTPTPTQPTGTLQGPFPLRDENNNITAFKQGMPATPNSVKQATQDEANRIKALGTPTPTPNANGLYQDPYARTPEQIAQLARDRVQKILQAGRTSAQGALTGAKNAYDYTNQIQGDNRNLRNASLKESANPFGGNFGYQAAQNNRNDSIQDTADDKDYNAAVGQINQKLADLEAAAPGDEQAIIDQLEQIERQTGISVAQLQMQQQGQQAQYTGQYINPKTGQYQNTIQKDAQDLQNQGQTIQNQLAQYQLDNYPAEAKAKATLLQQQIASGALSQQAAEYNFKQLKDPNSPANLAAKLDLQMKQIDASTYSQENKLKLQQLQKQIADIGVVHYKPQTANEIEMDKVKLDTAKAELAKLQTASSTSKIDPKESTDNLTFYQEQVDLRPNLTKAQKLSYAQGQKSGLSDSDYNKLVAYINANS